MFYSRCSDKTHQRYYLRARRHDRQLVNKSNRLFGNNFTIHRLHKKTVFDLSRSCIMTVFNKDDDDDDGGCKFLAAKK